MVGDKRHIKGWSNRLGDICWNALLLLLSTIRKSGFRVNGIRSAGYKQADIAGGICTGVEAVFAVAAAVVVAVTVVAVEPAVILFAPLVDALTCVEWILLLLGMDDEVSSVLVVVLP